MGGGNSFLKIAGSKPQKVLIKNKESKLDMNKIQEALGENEEGINNIMKSEMYLQKYGYQLLRFLGAGQFGCVMEGKKIDGNQEVAIKIMIIKKENDIKNCIEEATLMAQIQSPYVVRIKDQIYDDLNHHFYLIMQYYSGGNLSMKIQNKYEYNLSEKIQLFSDILKGLMAIHPNIIHGDLKPENIVFNSQGEALLADFGFSKRCISLQQKDPDNKNTYFYSSLEQIDGEIVLESDYYSIGMLLFTFLRQNTTLYESIQMKYGNFPNDINQSPNKELFEITISMMNQNPKLRCSPSQALLKLDLIQASMQLYQCQLEIFNEQ